MTSLETQGQSVGSGEKAGRTFSSMGEWAPGYRLFPNYFPKFKRMPAPNWAQKMLCIIVPIRWTVPHHNLLNIWNEFQLINKSCFYFEPWALLNCPSFILEWSHVRILKPSNQSELCHLDTCLLTRSLSLFSHEISNSGHFATKFSIPSLPSKSSCSLILNNNSYSLPKGFSNHLEFSLKS